MDSSNLLDLRHQPEELLLLHASTALNWNQDPLLYGIELIPSISTSFSNSKDEDQLIDPPPFAPSHHMVEDHGFQWTVHNPHSAQQIHLAKIKEEISIESFLKLEQYKLSSAVLKHEEQRQQNDLNVYQPSPPIHGHQGLDPLSFGMLLPGLNIPNIYLPSMETSLGMDIEALDFLASARFGRIGSCQSSNLNTSTYFDNMNYGLSHQLHSPAQGGFVNLQEIPPSVSGLSERKRANYSSLDQLQPSRKPRFDSRPSITPFKVRKEKLGDRIAALQQLVAPFGKTDTASVLMEAIGYIKFLQDQVETLSVPYMGTSSNRNFRTTEEESTTKERDDSKPDLRSRGLCLVPLSCTSYVTNDNAVWSPPNFT
ncbi:transcription factor bHLH110 isoform X2 [Dendrobium catenatum]|uniref:Transcription factor bHLH110 n=1 Tax=Dendrobium catenatum TaxID=906689 RepID=A0A2I0WVS4_9ASPA|nr:transcription factor bHLH110 isoform X2 [Dendrobium catenatum]PKU79758.1 Transcription factor bHLH110 [Dendrobium catenatum]